MVYYANDVQITLKRLGGKMEIDLHRRSRKGFRARLLAMEGQYRRPHTEDQIDVPVGWLDEVKKVIAEEYPDWRINVADERAKIKRPGDRIAWADEQGGFHSTYHNGYVGEVRLFRVSRTYTSGKSGGHKDCLYTELPGYTKDSNYGIGQYESREAAEIAAEQFLKHFLARIGAELKEQS